MRFTRFNKFRPFLAAAFVAVVLCPGRASEGAGWEERVSPGGPGDYPALPTPFRASYRIGWSGLTAAKAEMLINRNSSGTYEFRAESSTVGPARALWTMDAVVRSTVSSPQLRPIRVEQVEERTDQTLRETVQFDATGVERVKTVVPKRPNVHAQTEAKRFDSPLLLDFMSTFLNLRSQPLANGDSRTVALMSPSVPYLMTITVRDREQLKIRAGQFRAIKVSIDSIQRIKGDGTLVPHKRFRSATVWLSDDATRQILRVQSQVFIGAVFLELDTPPRVASEP